MWQTARHRPLTESVHRRAIKESLLQRRAIQSLDDLRAAAIMLRYLSFFNKYLGYALVLESICCGIKAAASNWCVDLHIKLLLALGLH